MYFEDLADYHWTYYIRVCLSCYQLLFKYCQNLYYNNDFDLSDQNRSGNESQNKYCKTSTLSSFSIFYTEKLAGLRRKEFLLRAVVMKQTGYYICLIVLLNSRAYIERTGYVLQRYLDRVAYHGRCCFSSNFEKGSIFDPFCFRGFITVKTPELFSLHNLYCKFYMRPKENLFE